MLLRLTFNDFSIGEFLSKRFMFERLKNFSIIPHAQGITADTNIPNRNSDLILYDCYVVDNVASAQIRTLFCHKQQNRKDSRLVLLMAGTALAARFLIPPPRPGVRRADSLFVKTFSRLIRISPRTSYRGPGGCALLKLKTIRAQL
jgi:hypothetical protein